MKIVQNSLAAAGVAAMIAGAVLNPAYASEISTPNPLQIERFTGSIVLAENPRLVYSADGPYYLSQSARDVLSKRLG